ncbi:MAG: S49 family peptidase [Thiogranum sp.]|nr:S49 family peptidase [Thiogranum sp.]
MASNQDPDQKTLEKAQSVEWQQDLINRLAFAAINEQRRARRWSIFFKFVLFAYLVGLLFLYTPSMRIEPGAAARHTALVEVDGVIASDKEASADNIVEGLRSAFENKNSAAVILRINSPGGSPVQAGYVNDEIRRLRTKYPDKQLYAVISDICASGGYYIAAAADSIYADKASIVGSIGVRMDGFGFVEAIEKLGIERRLLTAGENKGFLDPFQPVKEADVAHVTKLLEDIHQQFIDVVQSGRGDKLKDDPLLFSGFVWTGEQAVDLGLVDALGSAGYVAREVIGAETIVDYTPQEDLFERFSKRLGTALANGVSALFDGGGALR